MGKSKKTTQDTSAEPWGPSQHLLTDLIGDTRNTYLRGGFDAAPWSGMRVAPQSNMTTQANQQIYGLGQGNPFGGGAQSAYDQLISGAPQDVTQMKENTLASVIPAVSSRFAQSGMLDSSMAADTMARSAAEAVAPIEYQAISDGRNRQMQAMGMSDQLNRARFTSPIMMGMAGGGVDQYNQAVLDSAIQAYGEQANRPYSNLERAASLALGYGGLGGTQNTIGRQPSSFFGNLIQAAGSALPLLGK